MKKFLIFSLVILAGYVVSAATVHYVDEKNDRFVKFIAQDLARCLTAVSGEKYEAKTAGAKVKGDRNEKQEIYCILHDVDGCGCIVL